MTRGTNGVRGYTPGAVIEQSFECQALSHRIPAGHRIGVEVTSLDMWDVDQAYIIPYFKSSNSSVVIEPSSPSYVDLPLVGNAIFVDVPRIEVARPNEFILHQNYPNPFNPATNISFALVARQQVRLEVFSVLGQRVALLIDGSIEAGTHVVQFNGGGLASGVYFARLTTGGAVAERKMVLLR